MRSIRRYEIACDGKPHAFRLCYDPVFVAAGPFRDQLYFWAEHSDEVEEYDATMQVFATGDPLPDQYLWLGSVVKGTDAVHLISLAPPGVVAARPIMELIEDSSPGTPLRERTASEAAGRALTLARERRLPGPVDRLIRMLEKPGAELCQLNVRSSRGSARDGGSASRSRPASFRSSGATSARRRCRTGRVIRPARRPWRSTTGRKVTYELGSHPARSPGGFDGCDRHRSRVDLRGHRADGDAMITASHLYYGAPTVDHYCSYHYKMPGRRCPNHVDFHVKVPDGRDEDWRQAWAACMEHLPAVIWQMQLSYGAPYSGEYLLRAVLKEED